jgi:hypothetical protein
MTIWNMGDAVIAALGRKNQHIKDILKKFDEADIAAIKTLKSGELDPKLLKQKKDYNLPIVDYKNIMKNFLDSASEAELTKFVSHHLKYGGHNLNAQQLEDATREIVTDVINNRTKPHTRTYSTELHAGFLQNPNVYGNIIDEARNSKCRDPVKISMLIFEKVKPGFYGYTDKIQMAREGRLNPQINSQRARPRRPVAP